MNIYQGTLALTHKSVVARDTLKLTFEVKYLQTLTGEETPVAHWSFVPGQFVSLGFDEKTWRAYSVASVPDENRFDLVVRLVEGGKGSMFLDQMSIGEALNFKGAFGHFLLSENLDRTLVFCGTGTGIAPLRSMILSESAKDSPRKMILLYGGRNAEDISYLDEIESWSQDLEVYLGLSRDPDAEGVASYAQNCRITHFLETKVYPENAEFYICGNGDMVKSVQEVLESQEVDSSRIFMERFN